MFSIHTKEVKMSGRAKTVISRFSVILGIGALLASVVGIPPQVLADQSPGGMRGHSEYRGAIPDVAGRSLHKLLRHKKDLGLTEEQSAKLKALSVDYAKTRIREEADFKLAEVDVRTLVRDEKADLSAIETAMKKAESARTVLRLEGVKTLRAATAVLTPEQREKWRAGMTERHSKSARSGGHGEGLMAIPDDLPKREG